MKDVMVQIQKMWDIKRQEEASTMFINRKPTEDEIERAMIIGKWFFGWNDTTGTCPISILNEHWHKKVCALLEWIAMLESELQKKKTKTLKNTCSLKAKCVLDNYAYSTVEEKDSRQ
jgi:hypothetical protein